MNRTPVGKLFSNSDAARAALIAVLLVCSSCTGPSTSAPSTAAPGASSSAPKASARVDPTSPYLKLKKGMTAAEVRALLGEPAEIKKHEQSGIVSETWLYYRTVPGPVHQVATDMDEIPVFDGLTGQTKIIKQPRYRMEQTKLTETTGLLMIKGILGDWTQVYTPSTSYN